MLAAENLDRPLVWLTGGACLSRRAFLDLAHRLAKALPDEGPVLALTADRARFALTLVAGLMRGQANVLPPNHTVDLLARLVALHPQVYAVADDPAQLEVPTLRVLPWPPEMAIAMQASASRPGDAAQTPTAVDEVLSLKADQVVASVFTSGSTGDPQPHEKRWGLLAINIDAEARRVAEFLCRPDLRGVTLVGTVPAQHMYGFESTVMLALRGGAAFAAERPFYPADVVRVLHEVPRPRVLVTTPFHLRMLLESGLDLPEVDLTVSATAPLAPQWAQRAEQQLRAPLMEIYGCTEAGQVATRRPTVSPEWRTFDGLVLSGDADGSVVSGGHVPEPVTLADVLDVLSPDRFRLLGRSNDLVNIAGKRSSLSHLNHHLNSVPGVLDGVFHLPASAEQQDSGRLVAAVVAPGVTREQILAHLRQRVDAVFLPRRIVMLESIPRDATGKIPTARLASLF